MPDTRDIPAKLLSLIGRAPEKPVCLFDFPRVGGATYYSLRRLEAFRQQGRGVLRLTCNADGSLNASVHYRDLDAAFQLAGAHVLREPPMPEFGLLLVNELVTWTLPASLHASRIPVGEGRPRWIPALAGLVGDLAGSLKARLEVVIHDYFAVCPNFVLLNDEAQERYCGVPGGEGCRECMRRPFMRAAFGPTFSIDAWRAAWGALLRRADAVTCPSDAARDILLRAYGDAVAHAAVVPHEPLLPHAEPLRLPPPEAPMHVVVVGQLTVPKGASMVRRLAPLLQARYPGAKLTVVGALAAPGPDLPYWVGVTGPYAKENLGPLLRELGATVGLIPSVWPETFHYVTQELMALGLPLACFDLGAPAGRIGRWEHGLVAKEVSAEAALEALTALDGRRKGGLLNLGSHPGIS